MGPLPHHPPPARQGYEACGAVTVPSPPVPSPHFSHCVVAADGGAARGRRGAARPSAPPTAAPAQARYSGGAAKRHRRRHPAAPLLPCLGEGPLAAECLRIPRAEPRVAEREGVKSTARRRRTCGRDTNTQVKGEGEVNSKQQQGGETKNTKQEAEDHLEKDPYHGGVRHHLAKR